MKTFVKLLAGLVLFTLLLVGAFLALAWEPDKSVAELKERWAPPPSVFVSVAGMDVHLRDEGPRDDPAPILLVHGTSASLHTWDGWAERLREKRRVIRFDTPGFGLTGPAPDGDYSIDAYVRFVMAVADHLGVERFVIAGNSLGGTISLATALAHPDRVEKLILVDSGGYPIKSTSMPIGFRIARTPVLNLFMQFTLPRSFIEDSVRNVYGDPGKVTTDLVDRYFDLTLREGNRAALVARFNVLETDSLAERVPSLRIPTLVMWGRQDRLILPESGERFADDITTSRLVVFEDLGHVPQEEDPARTVEAVVRFLD